TVEWRGLPPGALRRRALTAGAAPGEAGRVARAVLGVEEGTHGRDEGESRAGRERDPADQPGIPVRAAEAVSRTSSRHRAGTGPRRGAEETLPSDRPVAGRGTRNRGYGLRDAFRSPIISAAFACLNDLGRRT